MTACQDCAGTGRTYAYRWAWFPAPFGGQFRIVTADPFTCFWCGGTGQQPAEMTSEQSHDAVAATVPN